MRKTRQTVVGAIAKLLHPNAEPKTNAPLAPVEQIKNTIVSKTMLHLLHHGASKNGFVKVCSICFNGDLQNFSNLSSMVQAGAKIKTFNLKKHLAPMLHHIIKINNKNIGLYRGGLYSHYMGSVRVRTRETGANLATGVIR